MAETDPTGHGAAVALTIPTHHAKFLRFTLDACREGVEDDLAGQPSIRNRERAERDAAAYEQLRRALDTRAIVPDADVIRVLTDLAERVDTANDYEQVVLEHRALCGLLAQVEPAGIGGGQIDA